MDSWNQTPGQTASSIAVAIPCFNEAAAIPAVLAAWRQALPGAELVVFDNNSTDQTGDLARASGARVVEVPRQGKGHAVRAAFADLADRNVVVLVDGDGTYPASEVGRLLAPLLDGSADMTVGARRPTADSGAMTWVRGVGNRLIRTAFGLLIGAGPGDLLSGYRAFNRHFRETVTLRSSGFEIETELTSEAVARGLRVVEVPVSYHPRMAGTASKLHAVRDGTRIIRTILLQGLRLRPWRPMVLALVILGALIGAGWLVAWIGLADTR